MLSQLVSESVLIIDDDSMSVMLLESLLSELGYDIHAFTSGEQALSKVKELEPDLIILDIHMPGMDGFEVCQKLKDDEDTMDIPVIFASSATTEAEKVRGFLLGAVDYVTKPIGAEELKHRVTLHLELSFQRSLSSHFTSASRNYHNQYIAWKGQIRSLKKEVNSLAKELGRPLPYLDIDAK